MTLKVLLATAEAFPTYRPDVRVLFGEALPRLGVQVDLLALTDPHALEPGNWPAGAVFARVARGRLARAVWTLGQQLSLLGRCRRGYDALIVRDQPILGLLGWLAARLARIPFCYWMSYPLSDNYLWRAQQAGAPWLRRAYWWLRGHLGRACLRRVLLPHSDWVFVQTQTMQQSLRDQGLRHARVSAVPMGVDPDAVPTPAPLEDLPPALHDRRLAVYLGTLDRYRQPELMVEAALLIAREYPDFCLMVIGDVDDPREQGWIEAYVAARGAAPWVCLMGRLPQRRAWALARHAEFGFSPVPRTPLTEVGSPTKAMEYLACGVPVVANDQPDQAWVVQQSGGGLLVPFEAPALAEAALTLLHSPRQARQRGRAGQAWVREHRAYAVLAAQVAQSLHTCVAQCRARRQAVPHAASVRS